MKDLPKNALMDDMSNKEVTEQENPTFRRCLEHGLWQDTPSGGEHPTLFGL